MTSLQNFCKRSSVLLIIVLFFSSCAPRLYQLEVPIVHYEKIEWLSQSKKPSFETKGTNNTSYLFTIRLDGKKNFLLPIDIFKDNSPQVNVVTYFGECGSKWERLEFYYKDPQASTVEFFVSDTCWMKISTYCNYIPFDIEDFKLPKKYSVKIFLKEKQILEKF